MAGGDQLHARVSTLQRVHPLSESSMDFLCAKKLVSGQKRRLLKKITKIVA